MMAPPPARIIAGATACVRKNADLTLTAQTRSNVSSSVVSVVWPGKIPALFTRMSMRPPSSPAACSASARLAAALPRSACT